MKKTLSIISLAAATLASANAALLLSDDFNSYPTGDLVGQGGWVQTGSATANPIQINNGIVNLAQGSSQDANNPFAAVTSGSLYYFATINVSAKNGTADYFIHLGDGSTSNFGARLYAKSTGAGYQLGWGGSSTAPAYGAELAFNTSYYVIFRYDIVPGAANDTGKLYVSDTGFNTIEALNPVYQDVATWTGGNEVASFAALYLRQGSNTGSETIDQIRVGTTFADAMAPVPEPAPWMLLGLGCTVVLWNARRKFRTVS